jgi:hypothetical protein
MFDFFAMAIAIVALIVARKTFNQQPQCCDSLSDAKIFLSDHGVSRHPRRHVLTTV